MTSRLPDTTISIVDAREHTTPRGERSRTRLASRRLIEDLANAAGLLAAPVITFFALQVRAIAIPAMIDPFLSTAYAVDGPDLMRRFGTGDYYWTRVGFSLPAHAIDTLAGPVAGFFLFRYLLALLATVPLFMLFRRVRGTAAAWIAVVALLSSPVIIVAWSTDYPTTAGISYLTAGTASLFMPAASLRMRAVWSALAGVFFGLAIGCHPIAALVIVGALGGRLLLLRRSTVRLDAAAIPSAVAGIVIALAALALGSRAVLGQADFLGPQLEAMQRLQSPGTFGYFHSATWRWLVDDTYLLMPLAVLGAWLVAAWPVRRRNIPPAELGIAAATPVAYALHVVDQFVVRSWGLEYWLYAYLLWALSIPLFVFTALRVAGVVSSRGTLRTLVVGAVVIVMPLVLRAFRDELHLRFAVALALVLVAAAAALLARLRPRIPLQLGGAGVVVAAASLLVMAQPKFTLFPGQVPYIMPDPGTALFGRSQPALDDYTVVTRLHDVVPQADAVPGGLAMWLPPRPSQLTIICSAQYLFTRAMLPDAMPEFTAADAAYLRAHDVRVLVLLSDSGAEFPAARTSIAAQPLALRTLTDTALSAGSSHLHVEVFELSSR